MSESESAFFNAGVLTGVDHVIRMVRECVPDDVRKRLDNWRESVINAAYGIKTPSWSPPESFRNPVAIPDSRLPQPIARQPRPSVHDVTPQDAAINARIIAAAEGARPPPPEPWRERVAGGKTALQFLRERP